MKINLWLEVDIPVGLYCNKCNRSRGAIQKGC